MALPMSDILLLFPHSAFIQYIWILDYLISHTVYVFLTKCCINPVLSLVYQDNHLSNHLSACRLQKPAYKLTIIRIVFIIPRCQSIKHVSKVWCKINAPPRGIFLSSAINHPCCVLAAGREKGEGWRKEELRLWFKART